MARPKHCLTRHGMYFILGRKYRCKNCSIQFNNLAHEVTRLLPECISRKLPMVFSHRDAIERYVDIIESPQAYRMVQAN